MSKRKQELIEGIQTDSHAVRGALQQPEEAINQIPAEEGQEETRRSYELLIECLDILDASIENDSLYAIPVMGLTDLKKVLVPIPNALTKMTAQPVAQQATLHQRADLLQAALWDCRLVGVSPNENALQEATGKLSRVMEDTLSHMQVLRDGIKLRDEAQQAVKAVHEDHQLVKHIKAEAQKLVDEIQQFQASGKAHSEQGAKNKQAIEELLALAQQKVTALSQLEEDIQKWHKEIVDKRRTLTELQESTDRKIKEFADSIKARAERLDEFDVRIEQQFRLASSGALAMSFDARSQGLERNQTVWGYIAIFVLVAIVMATSAMGTEFFLKSSDSIANILVKRIPVGMAFALLAWFVIVQYNRARRLRESYAFKCTVASSFDAYRKLVEEVMAAGGDTSQSDYSKFIVQTVGDLYKSPPVDSDQDAQPPKIVIKEMGMLLERISNLVGKIKS